MKLPFIKMHGLGNDYIYVDCFPPPMAEVIAQADLPALARQVSDRHFGVGSDGLVLILPSKEADACMRIFNADGSEAQMCGNAIRCVGKYLYENAICPRPRIIIETLAGLRTVMLDIEKGDVTRVKVNMGVPQVQTDRLMRGKDPIGFISVNMGNPHAVFIRDNEKALDEIGKIGHSISTHPHFPEGTNVEFVYVRNPQEIDVRVWERGTGFTLACGTGACAAAVAAMLHNWTERQIFVHLPGGDLEISWEADRKPVFMTGPATEVFRGVYNWDE